MTAVPRLRRSLEELVHQPNLLPKARGTPLSDDYIHSNGCNNVLTFSGLLVYYYYFHYCG